jgi:hypothetical protein
MYLMCTVSINSVYSYKQERAGFESQSEEIFSLIYTPTPAVDPTPPPLQRVVGFFPQGKSAGT